MKAILSVGFCLALLSLDVLAQHEHMAMHHAAAPVRLEVKDNTAAGTLTVRLGPLNLPAHASHVDVAQPSPQFLAAPFDGWLIAYHPRLTDQAGTAIPGRLLHHVAFYNTSRADFLCPNKQEHILCPNKQEHIFGAGGEMNDWPATPGFGYRVHPGDRIRITSMFHNPTGTSYPAAYLEVRMEYPTSGSPGTALKSVYPTWLDVNQCRNSEFDLNPGQNVKTATIRVGYSGILLGVGGHMHDYGKQMRLDNVTRNENMATLDSKLDATGHIVSMPIKLFISTGGYHLNKGDELKVTATYDNPTAHHLPDGAMGIVVGYFLPDDDQQMAALHRDAKTKP